jgi:hypothetical protein
VRWLLLLLALAGCATKPPGTIEEARRQYQRNRAKAPFNAIPYYRPKI